MKILHIIDSMGVGGAEQLLSGIIDGMPDVEHHLMILGGDEAMLEGINAKVRFTNLGTRGVARALAKSPRVRRYIKKNGIDLVHAHLYLSGLVSRLATPADVPLFNSIHNVPSVDIYERHRFTFWLDKLTYKKRHHLIAVSKEVLTDFDRMVGIKGSAEVLYNYIRDEFWTRPGGKMHGGGLKLVSVGNLRPPKNYGFALEAFRNMPAGVSLDIYGEGALRPELQRVIDQYGLPVQLCGLRKDLDKYLHTYDAFLMCSHYEGQPVALLEAMATGLPAVLSDIPVLREVAGPAALYFDLSDSQSLVRVVSSILNGEADLARLGREGRERVEDIAKKEHYLGRLRELYKSHS